MKRVTPLFLALLLVACGAETATVEAPPPAAAKAVPETAIGLYEGTIFDTLTPDAVTWEDRMPGSGEVLTRMVSGAPPAIPHGMTDFLPITREENGCIECHLSDDPDEEAPQLPDDHRTDLRAAPEVVGDATTPARWVCTACHVPVSDAKPFPVIAPDE